MYQHYTQKKNLNNLNCLPKIYLYYCCDLGSMLQSADLLEACVVGHPLYARLLDVLDEGHHCDRYTKPYVNSNYPQLKPR